MESADLSRRVKKVVGYSPLLDMDDSQRREFHEALLDADSSRTCLAGAAVEDGLDGACAAALTTPVRLGEATLTPLGPADAHKALGCEQEVATLRGVFERGSQDSNLESPVLETGALSNLATAPRRERSFAHSPH
jgi:hypothetical protein